MTKTDIKTTVRELLRTAAEAALEGERPDLVVGLDLTRHSRTQQGAWYRYRLAVEARAAEVEAEHRDAEAEYEANVRSAMAAQLGELRTKGVGLVSKVLGSRHLPKDLRTWGVRQLERAQAARSSWGVAYLYLVLRDALDWEHDHLPEWEAQDALSVAQRRWVDKHCADEGRSIVYYNEDGDAVEVKNVSDSPSRASLDPRGWDRPSSIGRRVGKKKAKAKPFAIDFTDLRTGHVFQLTNTGWYYDGVAVATSVAQRLDERKASGRLAKGVHEVKPSAPSRPRQTVVHRPDEDEAPETFETQSRLAWYREGLPSVVDQRKSLPPVEFIEFAVIESSPSFAQIRARELAHFAHA